MKLLALLMKLPLPARLLVLWWTACAAAPAGFLAARAFGGQATPLEAALPVVALALAVVGLLAFEPPRSFSPSAWRRQLARRADALRTALTSQSPQKESRT